MQTVCEGCCDIECLNSEDKQRAYIYNLAQKLNSCLPEKWKDREWKLLCPISECYNVIETLRDNQDIQVHLCCSGAIHY